ncbi:MAG: FHA domain-containing protein [Thermoflexales bacterium]|nr:FHA domain-containing protein [Thermoflexales bacterium]
MEMALLFGRLVLTGLLYLFLAAVFIVLWRDMRPASRSSSAQQRNGHLLVLEGDSELVPGTIIDLRPLSTLGRAATSTIVLADTFVSAEHAVITLRDGRWWLEDCDSRNGTTVNGVRIESPLVLSGGDVLGIGRVRLKLESDAV